MAKKGFIPKWESFHTVALDDYTHHRGDQSKLSPLFSDFGDVMKWLDKDI